MKMMHVLSRGLWTILQQFLGEKSGRFKQGKKMWLYKPYETRRNHQKKGKERRHKFFIGFSVSLATCT